MPVFSFIGLWDFDCDRWSSKNFVLMGVMIFFHTASSYGKAGLAAEHVTITRKAMGAIPEPDEVMFCPIDLQQDGVLIHSFVGEQHLQADFANEYLGGAVMRGGGSQEEELFLCCPELLATLFLVERMLDFEAVEIAGLRRYVDHNMCSGKTWSRSDQFCRPVPEAERLVNLTTVAMDAICFNSYGKLSKSEQYQPANVRREVRKCLVALRPPAAAGPGARRSFVTGLWGCGAFRGDPELKCVIQWICCSLDASVDKMIFCPFDQRECLSHAGLAELVDLLPGRVSAKRVLDLLVEDQDYAWSSSTFRYLLKKLASVGDSPQPPSS
ncbi:unnamed protein product [Prorocentrum cordatum]|uniref:PARG catalytic Macro domain-containing protein n=1 Tax=Prorocentrum cordatum TaxID=2364126 RepID=A0ABN9WD26_9DINO|nr:unnamed protein product [Polarella glacialis]